MQQTPIACRPLADWLGQSVRFQGYLSHWETADRTGDTAFLLRHVKVVPYKGCKEQIRTLDHIWLYMAKDVEVDTKFERFGGYAAVGRVVSYIRSNGTKDFAIDIESYIPMKWRIELLKSCKNSSIEDVKIKTILLEKTLTSLELEELDFNIEQSYEEIYQHFQEEYKFYRRQVEINERYEANKQHRSRPNPDILKFASVSSKSTKVACKGFAAS
ncbi:hypothetical protein IQ273_32245 [Nodosilinea sp. LEGE 07298]|jgi:hypothetical protein|uniref:hypothetical protein n=1 Tax=Nodosilinea sp. LEGE 07298 TaxID=2777970 RepID=UPI00187E8894|nr:hypothetical protein [Nodosilinea sp. LEGE 07298]MBE9114040.1 hypothetical protein [Nodosilinea sp. LEGE 07298]